MDGLQGMADQAKAAGIRVAWITPQPLDNDEQGSTALTGYNRTLEKFSAGVKQIAEKNQGLFVDQFHPYLETLDRARSRGPKYDRITDGDAVHPGPPGQALMAASILKGLHFPTLVAAAEIDATTGKVVSAKQTTIDTLTVRDGGVSFTRLDAALPFFPADAASMLPFAPILDQMNDYRLKVTGLKDGQYEVKLNGVSVTKLSASELAEGANLAAAVLAAGPIAEQVQTVREAVEAKNRYHHDEIFRGITLAGVSIPDWLGVKLTDEEIDARRRVAVAERLEKMKPLDEAVAAALKMKTHTVEIVPVK